MVFMVVTKEITGYEGQKMIFGLRTCAVDVVVVMFSAVWPIGAKVKKLKQTQHGRNNIKCHHIGLGYPD